MWRLRGSLHPVRLASQTAMNHLLADNDVFEFEGCLLVVPRREPRLFLLNATARMMWQELAGGVPPDEVADALAARFDVPPAQVRADMAAILAEWSAHNLLTRAPPPDGAAPSAGQTTAAADPSPVRGSLPAERVYRLCGRPIRVRCDACCTREATGATCGPSRRTAAGSIELRGDRSPIASIALGVTPPTGTLKIGISRRRPAQPRLARAGLTTRAAPCTAG